jgi:hypothetical protein
MLVHSIDGKKLLNAQAQQIFGFLTKIAGFRIIASFDH